MVSNNGENLLITKGAPEEISKVISFYEVDGKIFELNDEARSNIERRHRELSTQGFRVLAISYLAEDKSKINYSVTDENKMVFLGFIAFIDPLKETAGESIELLRQAGVKLKILTGDNEVVAAKISQQVGFQVSRYHRGKEIREYRRRFCIYCRS